jgi:hypothetical protein
MTTHEADLDGRCENCGVLIGFHGTHSDEDCVRSLRAALDVATEAMRAVLGVCRSSLASRALELAESIVTNAFTKLDIKP